MHFKKMATRLIVAGTLGLLFGLFMDTTVETGLGRVHNIHLHARQQNLLMLSGFLFIGGIILFATGKLKNTKEDEEAEEAARAVKKNALKERVTQARATVATLAAPLRGHFSFDHLSVRLPAGIFVGIALGLLALPGTTSGALVAAAACLLYAHRSGNPRVFERRLLIANTAVYGLVIAGVIAVGTYYAEPVAFAIAVPLTVPGLISWIWLRKVCRKTTPITTNQAPLEGTP